MGKHKYQPINDYINFEDCLEKSGYKKYKPKIGTLGRALIEASKHQGRLALVSKMLDVYFNQLRYRKKKYNKKDKRNINEKQNS